MLYVPTFLPKNHPLAALASTVPPTKSRWFHRLWRSLCESAERPTRQVPYY